MTALLDFWPRWQASRHFWEGRWRPDTDVKPSMVQYYFALQLTATILFYILSETGMSSMEFPSQLVFSEDSTKYFPRFALFSLFPSYGSLFTGEDSKPLTTVKNKIWNTSAME